MTDHPTSFLEVLQLALDSPNGVTLTANTRTRIHALRMGLYRARNTDRRLQRKIYGPDAPSRFDVLFNTVSHDPTTGLYTLHLYRETDFLSSVSRAVKVEGLDPDRLGVEDGPRGGGVPHPRK